MKIALVSMPWARFDMAPAALGALVAILKRDMPVVQVDEYYENLRLYRDLAKIYEIISMDRMIGEFFYTAIMYPEKREDTENAFQEWLEIQPEVADLCEDKQALFGNILDRVAANIDMLLQSLVQKYDVVGFTTSYSQLFASLAVSRKLKRLAPQTTIVLGGWGVTGQPARSVLREYPFVDYIIQGEGDHKILQLLEVLKCRSTSTGSIPGVIGRNGEADSIDAKSHLDRLKGEATPVALDSLPFPNYDGYVDQAEALGLNISWRIPIVGSKGCWWDRVHRTGDLLKACYYCTFNSSGYRVKSAHRVAEEMHFQADRYQNLRFQFVDNVLRNRGVKEFTDIIGSAEENYQFTIYVRPSIKPEQMLALRRAGARDIFVGVEGLSNSYLQRIGKGTTLIQTLQAMRYCYELGIDNSGNLITHFPGTTSEEVAELVQNLQRYACVYQPVTLGRFQMEEGSAVQLMPERFGLSNVRSFDEYSKALPKDVWERSALFYCDYDTVQPEVDWTPFLEAWRAWQNFHIRLRTVHRDTYLVEAKPLYYHDGGSFLEIVDRRKSHRIITLRGSWRALYLHCMRIRSRVHLYQQFAHQASEQEIDQILEGLSQEDLLFLEGSRCLSLAVAFRPHLAEARMEREAAESSRTTAPARASLRSDAVQGRKTQ